MIIRDGTSYGGDMNVDTFTVRYNMYDVEGKDNFNWGRSSLSYQIYSVQ